MCSNRAAVRCLRAGRRLYQSLGLKHPLLLGLYAAYLLAGGTAFFLLEAENAAQAYHRWLGQLESNRDLFLAKEVLPAVFNNSQFLVFINADKTAGIQALMDSLLAGYEKRLGVRAPLPVYAWNFQNSVLYACSLSTTIGYGFLWPLTKAGRIASMLFTCLAIPFTLVVLQDLAGLLAKLLNYPGLMLGKCWEVFRFCTLPAVSEEKLNLAGVWREKGKAGRRSGGRLIFETILNTPTLIAVFALIGWIFAASFTFTIWERDWSLLTSFYFCFNSLTTIGTGDVVPTEPDLLLLMFLYIYLGLAVVSLFINLIYAKLTRAYWLDHDPRALPAYTAASSPDLDDEGGPRNVWDRRKKHQQTPTYREVGVGLELAEPARPLSSLQRLETEAQTAPLLAPKAVPTESDTYETFNDLVSTSDLDLGSCVTLGILQMQDRRPLLHAIRRGANRRSAKHVQTTLSLPARRVVALERLPDRCQVLPNAPRGFHYSHSVDDVTRLLVNTYD